jgi:hypothetical protein
MNFTDMDRLISNINSLISIVLNDPKEQFFEESNLIKPDFKNQELSFIRLVSWLYTIYFEVGKTGLTIIIATLNDQDKKLVSSHKMLVRDLRTKYQHNIDTANNPRDFKLDLGCMAWLKNACGKNHPMLEVDWESCSKDIIQKSIIVLNLISSKLEDMTGSDAEKNRFTTNWELTKQTSIPPFHFDKIISNLIKFVDVSEFDVVKYRGKNLDKWNKHIKNYYLGTDIESEMIRIVQSSIIKDFIHVLPVTIDDFDKNIMLTNELFIEAYKIMDKMHLETPVSKSEMLTMLEDKLNK